VTELRPNITIRKLDLAGVETFAYSGGVVSRTPTSVVVEAHFSRYERLDLGYAMFERGDRFVEYFYADRWYNIFEVHAAGDDKLRGWYCNVTRPADITDNAVSAVDLALDAFIYPDGRMLVLDEDEFEALSLTDEDRAAAIGAVDELRRMAARREAPFRVSGDLTG
jgi:predicted RNA-binding protein associated with RNAse of E/G family